MGKLEKILEQLPYSKPFLFVDKIIDVNQDQIIGEYTFKEDEFFYKGHFKNNPITPGVILIEVMGQIGLVSFSYFLLPGKNFQRIPLISHLISDFYKIVKPGEKVIVTSEKKYFRSNFLKCVMRMENINGELIATCDAILKIVE